MALICPYCHGIVPDVGTHFCLGRAGAWENPGSENYARGYRDGFAAGVEWAKVPPKKKATR